MRKRVWDGLGAPEDLFLACLIVLAWVPIPLPHGLTYLAQTG
jgi:hypothetical protein